MKKVTIGAAALAVFVSACGPAQPIVSDFNGDSVKIQQTTLHNESAEQARARAQAEADRVCQKGHKKKAEFASYRIVSDYTSEMLFLCLS